MSHLTSPVVRFLICLRIKTRYPTTRNVPEKGSNMDNREQNNKFPKPNENLKQPAATNVSTDERFTAVIENHTPRNGNQCRLIQETQSKRKK